MKTFPVQEEIRSLLYGEQSLALDDDAAGDSLNREDS